MAWDFETEPEFEAKLEWMREFVRDEIIPLEELAVPEEKMQAIMKPLKAEVKRRGLWAAHLEPELGGGGFGQVKLGLMHEILGQTPRAPSIFGNNAPDSGNAELIAVGGTKEQKKKWMEPLLAGEMRSAFSMTEPEVAGSDPKLIRTRARRDGDEWVIDGHKWFTSNGSRADFLITMAVTDPESHPFKGSSMFIVPTKSPGLKIVRDVPMMSEPRPQDRRSGRALRGDLRRLPHPLRERGRRRGGDRAGLRPGAEAARPGRIHHAMRWLGISRRAFDMLCERAVSRYSHGSLLSEKQMVQDWVATSHAEMQAARLLTLHAAWKMDKVGASNARNEIAVIKFYGASVLYNVIDRAIQVHGALGFSTDMPLERMYRAARSARLVDGADEVHKATLARNILKGYAPVEVPTEHRPTRAEDGAARSSPSTSTPWRSTPDKGQRHGSEDPGGVLRCGGDTRRGAGIE